MSFSTFMLAFGLLALVVRWMSVDEALRRRIAARIGLELLLGGGTARRHQGLRPPTSRSSPPGPSSSCSRLVAIAALPGTSPTARGAAAWNPCRETLLPVLADVLDETLDDLRAEADPRRAVIAAYARMERALAAYGLPRRPSEAPDEYLQRILADLDVEPPRHLALDGVVRAKFSAHDVAPG